MKPDINVTKKRPHGAEEEELSEEQERSRILQELGKFVAEGEAKSDDEEEQENPEDCIPDLPENAAAREFLRTAPTRGLYMPLGVEVKVMQCFRCKAYGHRTGDRECPLSKSGNLVLDAQRQAREDPMAEFVAKNQRSREEKYERVEELKAIMEGIRREERERKNKRRVDRKERKKSSKKKHKH